MKFKYFRYNFWSSSFSFRWNGFANAYSLMSITENDIVCIEEFVQNELEQRILDRCARLGSVLEENEKESFFGIYAGSIKDFKFMRGERIQILGIAESLRTMFNEKGKEQFSNHFEMQQNFKIDKSETHNFSFGWFYGQKPRKCVHKSVVDPDHLKVQLFTKLMENFHSLSHNQPISDDIIQIVDLGSSIRGDVICVLCPSSSKTHAIQYDKSGKWNLANFRKHLKIHMKKEKENKHNGETEQKGKVIEMFQSNSNIKTEQSNLLEPMETPIAIGASAIIDMPIHLEDFGIHFDEESVKQQSITRLLYAQFSNQNLRLIQATLVNIETKKFMVIKVDGDRCMNVNIVNIKADGNCMFGAAIHQLEYVKVNSLEHIKRTIELRKQVVSHIEDHFETYKHVIQLRIKCEDDKIDELGKNFLANNLSVNGFWGDSESLMAIANIFSVNIFVFRENGPFYFGTGFSPKKSRTIFLAYRCFGKEGNELIYNHYESVCEIDPDLLFKCASDLGTKMDKIEESSSFLMNI